MDEMKRQGSGQKKSSHSRLWKTRLDPSTSELDTKDQRRVDQINTSFSQLNVTKNMFGSQPPESPVVESPNKMVAMTTNDVPDTVRPWSEHPNRRTVIASNGYIPGSLRRGTNPTSSSSKSNEQSYTINTDAPSSDKKSRRQAMRFESSSVSSGTRRPELSSIMVPDSRNQSTQGTDRATHTDTPYRPQTPRNDPFSRVKRAQDSWGRADSPGIDYPPYLGYERTSDNNTGREGSSLGQQNYTLEYETIIQQPALTRFESTPVSRDTDGRGGNKANKTKRSIRDIIEQTKTDSGNSTTPSTDTDRTITTKRSLKDSLSKAFSRSAASDRQPLPPTFPVKDTELASPVIDIHHERETEINNKEELLKELTDTKSKELFESLWKIAFRYDQIPGDPADPSIVIKKQERERGYIIIKTNTQYNDHYRIDLKPQYKLPEKDWYRISRFLARRDLQDRSI